MRVLSCADVVAAGGADFAAAVADVTEVLHLMRSGDASYEPRSDPAVRP